MNRLFRWTLFLSFFASTAFGIDLETSFRFDNLYWAPTRTSSTAGKTFDGTDLFWNLQGSISQELGDGLTFKGGIEVDPILRARAYSRLGVALDSLTLSFTPFLGTFSSTQKWFNPGLEAMVEYTWPGLMFVRGGFLTTFAPVSKEGDYYLSSQAAAVGFLSENGIVSFNIEDKAATFRQSATLTTVDSSTKYWMDTEMFLKNFPLRWAILTGYQVTGRSYVTTVEVSTPVHSVLLGGRLSYDFGGGTVVWVQGEASLFNVGWNDTILNLGSSKTLFQTVAGVHYHW